MKKTLYGTTAIVALGLAVVAATPAGAQAPAPGFSSTNFQFTVGGLGRGFVGAASQYDLNNSNGRFDIQKDWRLDLTARASLPNGIAVGYTAQIAAPGQHNFTSSGSPTSLDLRADPWLRRNWVFAQSSFGLLQIGAVDNAAFQMFQGEVDYFTGGSVRTGKIYDFLVMGGQGRDDSAAGATNLRMFDRSSEKIAYFTPRIEGFQAGINYTPEASMERNGGLPLSAGGNYQRGYSGAVNYVNTIGGVGIRAYGGYKTWTTPALSSTTSVISTRGDPYGVGFGGGINYMGFDLGGSWARTRDLLAARRGTYSGNPGLNFATTAATLNGSAWSAGLGYVMGPARVSLNWFRGEVDAKTFTFATNLVSNPTGYRGNERLQGYALNAAYTMGPGVNIEASLFNVQQTLATTVTSIRDKQNATGLVTGLILSF
jgi:hypothetical protein